MRHREVVLSEEQVPEDELGPVDVVAVAFPDGVPHPEGFDLLLDLSDRGVIQVLDVEFVKADSGGARIVAASEFGVAGFDAELWAGASSGLLDEDDVAEVAADLAPGELAVVILVEQRWLLGLVDAWRGSGTRLLADGGVPVQDLIDALDAAERR